MKKALLAIIPALLVLSSCQAGPQVKTNNNIFLEDTLAHEELFNENGFGDFKKDIRKLDPIEHPEVADPAIGVQYKVEGSNVSFRFVAAVTISNAQLEPTVAKWTRTVSKPDGTDYVKNTAQVECQTVYTSLSADGDPYTIQQFNTDHSSNYTHFVVYTLRNIPVATYGDYYVSAYLTLSEGATLTSKAVAINVERTQQFTYDAEMGVSFLRGTIGGVSNKVVKATTIRTDASQDKATFMDLSLLANDSFVICEFYQTKLYVKNTANFTGDNNDSGNFFTNDNNRMKATYSGKFDLYLNKSDQIYAYADKLVRPLYVKIQINNWSDANAWTALYVFGAAGNKWVGLATDGDYLKSTDDIDSDEYSTAIVVRMNPEYTSGSFDSGKAWNQTGNISIPLTNQDCLYVYGSLGEIGASFGTRN